MAEETPATPPPGALEPLDADLSAALQVVAVRQAPRADFRLRLAARLQEEAAARRGRAGAADRGAQSASPQLPHLAKLNRRRAAIAVAAFGLGAAAAWALLPQRSLLPALADVSRRLTADQPTLLMAPAGRRVGVVIAGAADQRELARLELRDLAAVTYRPPGPAPSTQAPRFELEPGFVRVVAGTAVDVRVGDQELRLGPGADVAFELVRGARFVPGSTSDPASGPQPRGEPMRSRWLVPSSAAGGAAFTLAILVLQGQVAFTRPAVGTPAVTPTGQVTVLHPSEPAVAQRRAVELEQKVTALRAENGRLAGQLAQKKGVTKAGVLERIATLRNSAYGGLLAPAALADLVTDLKGLGDEGVKAMIELLGSKDAKDRFLATNVLEQLNAPAAIGALKQAALSDTDAMTVLGASHALAFMDDAAAVPALREIVDAKPSWGAQVNALWGLCKHGDARAIAESLAIMKDPKQTAQMRAGLGVNLMLLGDPELLPIVDETLRQFAHDPQGDDEQLGTLAVTYYKNAGTPEALARLAALAADTKYPESVRKAAREALGQK